MLHFSSLNFKKYFFIPKLFLRKFIHIFYPKLLKKKTSLKSLVTKNEIHTTFKNEIKKKKKLTLNF